MPPKRENPSAAAAATAFEYCELCRRNHDQGRRHRYFPTHRAALDASLSGFRSKLSDVHRALRSPSTPPHRSRLWCPFCSADLVDLDSRFACSNSIYHLASKEHLMGVKDFLRKHGGGMDQVDSFKISEDELAKWEKSCESSSTEARTLTKGLIGPSLGPLKAMGSITPLVQRVMDLALLEVSRILLHLELPDCPSNPRDWSQHMNIRSHSGGNFNQGIKANVHTGAPPPWLEASEHDPKNVSLASYALPSSRKGKSKKLNPKRVGAAWAERRRAEMEMEKRGELVPETSGSSWLPNFGSVWQSGTRKESKKEFEKNHKLHERSNPELFPEIKPYISKRMRAGSNKDGQADSIAEQ